MRKLMAALMAIFLFATFTPAFAQDDPVPIEAATVSAAPEVAASIGSSVTPAPAEVKKDFNFWVGIAAGIFLMIWPVVRLFITDAATRTALDAWAGIIQQLKIAQDPKTIKDLLQELEKLEPRIPKAALKQWKSATAKAKKRVKTH